MGGGGEEGRRGGRGGGNDGRRGVEEGVYYTITYLTCCRELISRFRGRGTSYTRIVVGSVLTVQKPDVFTSWWLFDYECVNVNNNYYMCTKGQ